jgi:hypothetical protein
VRLRCILMLTGVSYSWSIRQSFFERYTCLLMETSPEFLFHFLKIYIMIGILFFINWISVDRVLVLKVITPVLEPGINRFDLKNT